MTGRVTNALLVVCFLVCPLLFFTNLTRNPYITQICLLNVALLAAAALSATEAALAGPQAKPLARTPLDATMLGLLLACAASWIVAYFGHRAFFKPAMANEGLKAFLFLGANMAAPFYLAATAASRDDAADQPALAPWVWFVLVWGLLWTTYSAARGPSAAAGDIWGQAWDGYGALLWAAGLATAIWLCRKGRALDFLHLALATGFLASVYGILQYFNVELIWPNVLNPYGGRSVSTFGNPNFMSSFNVVLLPLAAAWAVRARGGRRFAYAAVFFALEGALLCSLTRSSWLGAGLALGLLSLSPELRREALDDPKPVGLLAALAAATALFWPHSAITAGYEPNVVGRVSEILQAARSGGAYSPWHQRLLIWTCAWQMGHENPLTGKGWGLFELFYPFYQGPILDALDFYRTLRTHANNAHNEVLELWSQTGLLGLGAAVWLWTTFAAAARGLFKRRGDGDIAAIALCAGVAGMLADNLLNVSVHFAVPAFMFWWAAGHAMGRCAKPGRPASAPLKAAAAVLLALAVGGGWYWWRTWNREAEYFAGFKLLRQKQMSAAVKRLELSRAWGPPEVNAIYELGNAYAQAQRYQDAEEAYRGALAANAGYDEIYYNEGAILSGHLGQLDRAIDFFRMAWWINPLSADVYNSLGNIFLQHPDRYKADAYALLARAAHFFPENPNHWNNLGFLYSLDKNYAQAEASYIRALELDPDLAVARRNLEAVIRAAGGARPEGVRGLDALREVETRVARKDYSDATIALARESVRLMPEAAKPRYLLGSLLLARGRAAEALESLEWAAAKEPRNPYERLNLGEAYLSLGRGAEAAREYQAVLAVDPGNAQAQARLRLLSGQGR